MKEIQNIFLTVVTENQTQKVKAEKLYEILNNELEKGWVIISIDKYNKFDNAYKIELKKSYIDKTKDELNLLLIGIADKIASPWLVYYDKDQNTLELIFNKSENIRFRRVEFNVIKWGLLKIA